MLYTNNLGVYDVYDLSVDLAHPRCAALVHALLHAVERACGPLCRGYILAVGEEDPLLPIYQQKGYSVDFIEHVMYWTGLEEGSL